MYEDYWDAQSSVAAYIASLPRTFSSPLYHFLLTNTTCLSGDEDWSHLGKAEEMPSDERVSQAVGLLLR